MTAIDGVRTLLDQPCYMRLATLMPDGAPQNTVLWYRLTTTEEGASLHVVCPASAQKVRNLDRDGRVSAVIEDPETPHRYVEIRGNCRVLRDDALARRELGEIAARYIGERAGEFVAKLSSAPRVVLQITPDQVRAYGLN